MMALLRLCRLYYAVPMASILTLTLWYALGERIGEQGPVTAAATVALALVIAGGYALNDVCDQRADATNAPHRPIPSGRARAGVAAWWAVVLLVGGVAVASVCRWQFQVALAVVVVAVVLYDVNSKRLGLGKQVLVAALMTSFYPLAFAQAGLPTSGRGLSLYLFPVWIFLTSFGYETLKDLRDVAGDRLAASRPSWICRRPELALAVARVVIVAGAVALVGPAVAGCGWVYRVLVPVPIVLGLVAAWLPQARARVALYGQFVLVGVAALADIMVVGP